MTYHITHGRYEPYDHDTIHDMTWHAAHLMVLAGETVPAVPVLVLAGLLWSRSRAARLLSPLQP